jgi:tetratricopeptide (TPR) repeat protein
MHKATPRARSVSAVCLLLIVLAGCSETRRPGGARPHKLAVAPGVSQPARLEILYPLDGALFPPDIAAPTFGGGDLDFLSPTTEWTVPDEAWETIKSRSREREARVTISGVSRADAETVLSQGSFRIRTSQDAVGAPIFFREVNLPFISAVKNPAAYIRWRFGPVSSKEPPPIVLDKLPVCGNCHSFSADGSVLGMDIDYANDKGSYAIAPVGGRMTLDKDDIITWSDYRREDGDPTFGLLSQVSPDGRYVVSTVKDRSVFVATDDLAFSQLFFPFKGILVVYDRRTREFHALPGADDERFVQSNPNWSPDGRSIVFARTRAYELKKLLGKNKVLLSADECDEFLKQGKTFRFDLYRIPFNEGRGGRPEPIEGASANGMSNYFPRFSPDGRWIVFCKARSFMLLQPDSELYILPAEGGEARRLRCNTSRMNSWHSWSPNGKWLVFSSKAYSIYTQLMLTHIDEAGRSTPPVVLSRFTAPQRAANIPEFVNAGPGAIRGITAAFLDDNSYFRAAEEFIRQDDPLGALPLFEKTVELNPEHVRARLRLASITADLGRLDEAKSHLRKVLECDPDHAEAHQQLAVILSRQGDREQATEHLRRALAVAPDFFAAHLSLGLLLVETGKVAEAEKHLAEAVRLAPDDPFANYYYGYVLHRQGKLEEAARRYSRALEEDPESVPALLALAVMHVTADLPGWYDPKKAIPLAEKACELTRHQAPDPLKILASVYAADGRNQDALRTADEALRIARAAGDEELARRIEEDRAAYERRVPDQRVSE